MMSDLYPSEGMTDANERSLQRLDRAIAISQGQFCLILACCNSSSLREKMLKRLPIHLAVDIQQLSLQPYVKTLYTTIQQTLQDKQPKALMIVGLESVVAIEHLLTATNFVRDDFRKDFAFPLILWVNDEIMQKLIRLAPDFKSWAASTIRFQPATDSSISEQLTCQFA